jgi:uncharacterized SAM-binding protein YcdF (DUF218 family)
LGAAGLACYLLGLVPSFATFGTAAFYLQKILLAGFALWLISFIIVEAVVASHSKTSADAGGADYLIVLGAGLRGSTPSPTLTSRLDAALDYLDANPETVVVVSGGQGSGEDIAEAEAMSKYLTEHGVHSEKIIEEKLSVSTAENLRFSFSLIDSDASARKITPKIAVLTNEFHIYRTGILAKRDHRDVSLISAPTPIGYLKVTYYVREYFGLLKALFVYS